MAEEVRYKMFNLAGGILIVIACGGVGLLKSHSLGERLRMLTLLERLMEHFSTQIRFRSLTLEELLWECIKNPIFKELGFLETVSKDMSEGLTFKEAWQHGVGSWNGPLNPGDKLLILSIKEELGVSDTEGQLAALALVLEQLKALAKEALEDYQRRGRLFRSLGVLGGIFISLLLV